MLACSKDGTLKLHSLSDSFKPHQSIPTIALSLSSRGHIAYSHAFIGTTPIHLETTSQKLTLFRPILQCIENSNAYSSQQLVIHSDRPRDCDDFAAKHYYKKEYDPTCKSVVVFRLGWVHQHSRRPNKPNYASVNPTL